MSSSPEPPNPARRQLTFLAVCIGQGMILLDNSIVNVALPAIQRGPLRPGTPPVFLAPRFLVTDFLGQWRSKNPRG